MFEWQVMVCPYGINWHDSQGWTVFADTHYEAKEKAKREQGWGGGRGGLEVRQLQPACELCGFRHGGPPNHLERDSYCR